MQADRVLAGIALAAMVAGCGESAAPHDEADGAPVTGIRYLADPAKNGFRHADGIRTFRFPADHGPHPEYRNEWWYVTGNLTTAEGRHFGFELTFFRLGLSYPPDERRSDWQADAVWMAHFAVTDTEADTFAADERIARSHRELAFASTSPLRIRVEDWTLEALDGNTLHLRAKMPGYALALDLTGLERLALQGDRGYDKKGPEPGNASYYYSAPRLTAQGTLTADTGTSVSGTAWLDREWGTSALSPDIEGWDWFALQLNDGSELMVYRLRGEDGSTSPFSGGSIVRPNGRVDRIDPDELALTPSTWWRSPESGVAYPVAWRLRLPGERLDIRITPVMHQQELNLSVRYWEGAIEVRGTKAGSPIAGRGYLELAGYR